MVRPSILHFISGLGVGGAERSLYTLLTNGIQGAFSNRVVSLLDKGHYGSLLEASGIPVTCLNIRSSSALFRALRRLRTAIAADPPTIIQGWMPHGNLAAYLACATMQRQAALSWNVRLSLESTCDQPLLTRLVTRINALLSSTPEAIVYNSVRSRQQHKTIRYNDSRSCVIPNGFDTQIWCPRESDRLSLRREFGLTEQDRAVGYVGRAHEQKDISSLFEAVRQVSSQRPGTVLICVGRHLERCGAPPPRCIFLGERSDVPAIMRTFDILCLSSRAEGFPNVLGEAMATGIPCVTTDVGDARTIVGDTGWVAPARNTTALRDILARAVESPISELRRRGRAARVRIQTHFSIAMAVSRYTTLYEDLISRSLKCVESLGS